MPRKLRPRASRLQQRCRGREHCREDRGPCEGGRAKRRCGGRDARGLSMSDENF